ncbi:MAG: hypothetical protein H7A36_05485 [Chlamydiales bacterium]|nr:hypothetical protein [Chlamydiales bacterium]
MKSERLKKLEAELGDLEQWMKLGLVPNKELERHKEEIHNLKGRIDEEKERLQFLKESGEVEEFAAPRRGPSKTVYPDTPSMSDIEMNETTEGGFEVDQETSSETTEESTSADEGSGTTEEYDTQEDDDDPFSDRNRWRRGGIIDPESNDW